MITKADIKAGRRFQTSYEEESNGSVDVVIHQFHTREANGQFAIGMELMGVKKIVKSALDPFTRKWLTYTDKIFYTQNL